MSTLYNIGRPKVDSKIINTETRYEITLLEDNKVFVHNAWIWKFTPKGMASKFRYIEHEILQKDDLLHFIFFCFVGT